MTKHIATTLPALAALALTALFGCASADDTAGAETDADITAAQHAQAIAACEKTEKQAIGRDGSMYGIIAAMEKSQACFQKANDKSIAQLDKRRRTTIAKQRFEAFRTSRFEFCDAPTQGQSQGTSGYSVQVGCRRDAEYDLAIFLELHAQLGGTSTAPCSQFTCHPLAAEIKACSTKRTQTRGTLETLSRCEEDALAARISSVDLSIPPGTLSAAVNAGNEFCDFVTFKVGRDRAGNEDASAACRTDVTSALYALCAE
ncbi:MAG: hypothetical protein U0174_15970 [Polyangiaceae bacterium]